MPSEQLPILFEDQDPKKKRTSASKKNKMQSEEDWTPQATTAEDKPAAPEAASDETKAKPRTRKPRAPRKTAGTEAAVEAEVKTPQKRVSRASGRKSATSAKAEAVDKEASTSAPAAAKAPVGEEKKVSPEPKAAKREEAGEVAKTTPPVEPTRQETQAGAESGEKRSAQAHDPRESRERDGESRSRQEQNRRGPEGGGNQERSHPRQGGGGGGGPDPRDRHGAFRGKKKKGKKGRFERPGGPGGGGGGGQQQAPARVGDLPDPSRFQDIDQLSREAEETFTGEPLYMDKLHDVSLHELVEQAQAMGIVLDAAPNRRSLIVRMVSKAHEEKRPVIDRGSLELTDRGYGFIVRHAYNYRTQPEDTYVAASFVRRFGLKKGHEIQAQVRPPEGQERCPSLIRLVKVMGGEPGDIADVVPFEDLVPYYPLQRMLLEIPDQEDAKDVSMRAVDLLTPVGFGQRGLIVAPPRTGKTVLLQQVANSIAKNNPDAHLIVLLVDERPEEVTDFRRNTRGEVVSSTFDEPATSHVEVAEMVIEKARRMVEAGQHVIILLDSITRLARAYNTTMPSSGKILSGGVEANALQKPKRFFGAARNIEGGGSLTILATALIDTGSRMDEVIFEEFKGTGNMELHLDRALVEKRIFPALNIERSGTRKEELLYHPDELNRIYSLRRAIQGVPMVEAMEMLVQRLKKTRSNAEFLLAMNR